MRNSKPILLVEDDDVDVMTVKRAFADLKITNRLIHKNNGKDALEFLRTEDGKKPCVIVSDLNMPKMNGLEFLSALKTNDKLKKIPVVVLTASGEEEDKAKSFELGVAGYMVKDIDYKKFVEIIGTIDRYWSLSELPNGCDE